jgi:hypothetical protein
MQTIKLNQKQKDSNFSIAHKVANEKARAVLGECLNIASYNGITKIVSPTLVACSTMEKSTCGAESYARANGAELEIDVSESFKFYYSPIKEEYAEPSPSPFEDYTKSGVDKAEWP